MSRMLPASRWSFGLVILLSSACFVSDEDRKAALDEDGDGVPLGEDCAPQDRTASVMAEWYADVDGDGYGAGDLIEGCEGDRPTTNTADNADDCDDSNPSAYPGADERYYDGVDQDCAGDDANGDGVVDDYDQDLDGYSVDEDCDDTDPTLKPDDSLSEVYYDGIDNDCNLLTGDGDKDGDGYWSVDYAEKAPGSDLRPEVGLDGDCFDDVDAPEMEVTPLNGFPVQGPEAVYPGSAAEISYDGIDSDCGGNATEFDSDGDGDASAAYADRSDRVGTDCQDCTSPCTAEADWSSTVPSEEINVDASETWYDGVDQDCRGVDTNADRVEDDYDVDLDGYAASGYVDGFGNRGDDCVDDNDGVHPDASDTWYDGIDTDCGGEDDFDADFDGYVPNEYFGLSTLGLPADAPLLDPGDCVDNPVLDGSSSVSRQDASDYNPSSADTWYDGYDHDCAGDDDYDADADGYRNEVFAAVSSPTYQQQTVVVLDSAATADDCNDSDASVSPGVSEVPSNNIDDNCDGAAAPEGIYGVNRASEHHSGAVYSTNYESFGDAVASGDLNGDGVNDLLVTDWGVDSGGTRVGAAYWFDGNDLLNQELDDTDYAGLVLGSSSSGALGYTMAVDDVDGDGVDDWVVGDPTATGGEVTSGRGGVYVFRGGLSGSASSPLSFDAETDADFILGTSDSSYLAYGLGVADETGDGVADLIVGAPYTVDDAGFTAGAIIAVDVAAGGTEADVRGQPTLYGDSGSNYLGLYAAIIATDMNGDGSDEITIGSRGYNTYQSSGGIVAVVEAPFPESSTLSQAASTVIYPDSSGALCGSSLATGDVDADGYDDLVYGCANWYTDGFVGVLLGGSSFAGFLRPSEVDGGIYGTDVYGSELMGWSVLVEDVTGDGQLDVLGGGYSYSETSGANGGRVVMLDGASASSGFYSADAVDGTVLGDINSLNLGVGLTSFGDLDGDGDGDIGIVGGGDHGAGLGAVYLFTGGEW